MNQHKMKDPVSATLSEFERSKKIYSSSQAMDRSIQKLITLNTLSRTPPQPSTSKISLDHYSSLRSQQTVPSSSHPLNPAFRSHQEAFQWCQIYLRFLKSSPNPEVFARRIKELIHKRLPKRLIEVIIRFHSSEEELVSVKSYNHLIAYYYQSERYHHARRLMKEMEERGISKNQETQELIACSYQALNKFQGVQLALNAIRADQHEVSHQCLTKLFSIRPRNPSKLEHFDSMDDPVLSSGTDQGVIKESTITSRTEDQRWMPIEDFLKHHDWNFEHLRKDGRALVTLTKRLMELGRWKEANDFVEMILSFDLNKSTTENPRLAISPYWATSLLEALVFGLYNLKRQLSTRDSSKRTSHRSQSVPNETNAFTTRHRHHRLPVDCIFQFVERFIDQHAGHQIKANTRIMLNCFRIQTFLAPSGIQRICKIWTSRYGLEPARMGSRLGIRLLHVISAWFLTRLRATQSQISNLDTSDPSSSLAQDIGNNLKELVKEYLIIDEHLIECLDLNQPRIPSSGVTRAGLLIERMILNGPVDGKLVRSNYRFISLQDLQSIKSSLKKIFKIRPKIIKLMMYNSQATILEGQKTSADLMHFYGPVFRDDDDGGMRRFLREKRDGDDDKDDGSPFNQKFHSLIQRFKTGQQQQDQLPDFSPQEESEENQHRLELVDKLSTLTRPPPSPFSRHPSAYHALLCWRSEDKHSSPIYFKSCS
ncbi:hypothetical protein VP01_762g4 [Puccinia sorghi]|uniref:Uncharacterized protein n=1 Tax=Puccinia sorghi TaxID=27349 RepID=A0A0L6UBW5_9BASI|nr:hypothetical protein VP01_762g4 [Puccinia sorghi]